MDQPPLYEVRPIKVGEVKAYAAAHGFGLLEEHRAIDDWLECEVDCRELRDMHGVFGRDDHMVQLEKGRRFVELLERFRGKIESDDFPCAAEIRTRWPNKPRIIVQQTLGATLLYVAEGEKRTFNALFNNEARLDAFVVRLDQQREVL